MLIIFRHWKAFFKDFRIFNGVLELSVTRVCVHSWCKEDTLMFNYVKIPCIIIASTIASWQLLTIIGHLLEFGSLLVQTGSWVTTG